MKQLYFVLFFTIIAVSLPFIESKKLKRCKNVEKDPRGRPLERCFCGYAENRKVCDNGDHCRIDDKNPYGYCWEMVKECLATKRYHHGVALAPCLCGKWGFCPDYYACSQEKNGRPEHCYWAPPSAEEEEDEA